jgi:hypothetical protein
MRCSKEENGMRRRKTDAKGRKEEEMKRVQGLPRGEVKRKREEGCTGVWA